MGLLKHIKRKWSERLVRQANRYLYDLHLKATHTPDHAVVRCQSAIRMAPDYPEAYLTLGNAYVEKGCYDDALRQFERAVGIDPDFYRGHIRLADTLHLKGDRAQADGRGKEARRFYEAAADAFRTAFALRQGDWQKRTDLGRVLEALGRREAAIQEYQAALADTPGNPWLLRHLAAANLAAGRHGPALSTYRQLLEKNPQDRDSRRGSAEALVGLGEAEAALAEYRRADDHIAAGQLLLAMERQDEALTAFESAVAQDRLQNDLADYGDLAYYHAGRLLFDRGDGERARAHLMTFLKLIDEKNPVFFTAVPGRRAAYDLRIAEARRIIEALGSSAKKP